MSVTRRAVLGAIAAASLAGCRPHTSSHVGMPAADRARVSAAIEDERALIALYDQAIGEIDAVTAARLTVARDRHKAHLRALGQAVAQATRSPAAAPVQPTAGSDQGMLSAALSSSASVLRAAAVATRTGQLAALLASVGAEHAADAARSAERP